MQRTILTSLQLINKVAGVYGLITVIVGGTFWQFLYYAYSFATLWAFLWALSVIKLEVAKKSLFVAHLYVIDHAIAWVFHYIFYYAYWYTLKHDGTRVLNSQAQKDIFELALSRGETEPLDAGRDKQAQLAHEIWNKEKGYALGVIAVGFLLKVGSFASERARERSERERERHVSLSTGLGVLLRPLRPFRKLPNNPPRTQLTHPRSTSSS